MLENQFSNKINLKMFALMFAVMATLALSAFSVNVSAATFVVNDSGDAVDAAPGDGTCATAGAVCTLRAAISEANALAGSDIITLPAGAYTSTLVAANENLNAGGDYDITSSITINGAGSGTTFIQANAAPNTATERVLHIITTGGTLVEINNVTVRHGNATGVTSGGGISLAVSSTLNLTNVVLTANRVIPIAGNNAFGGALILGSATAGAIATLTNCTVSNNSSIATNTATIVNGFAGGVYNQNGTLNIVNSSVTGNIASSFHGGIRTLSSLTPTVTNIINSTVSNNAAQGNPAGTPNFGSGGGIAQFSTGTVAANTCTTNITRSTVSGNQAFASGGAPGAGSNAGGIFNSASGTGATPPAADVNLTNSTVSGNSADVSGGIHNTGAAATSPANVNLDYSTVALNAALTNGGGLNKVTVTTGGNINLKDSIVADNTAGTSGPDIFGTITSQDYNHVENTTGGTFTPSANDVTGTDPALGALANNGGSTETHLPGGGSPVLNTIPSGTAGCGTTVGLDQRGFVRPFAAACEKGSVEVGSGPPSQTPTSTATATNTATNTNTATATATFTGTPVCTPFVIYDQTTGFVATGPNSQDFEAANDAFDNDAADDFVVPAGQTWTISQLAINGAYFGGVGPAASFNVKFFNDAATFPGATVPGGVLNAAPYTFAAGVFTITLPSSVVLTPGTYWVSVQARMDFAGGQGQWAWHDTSVTTNSAAVWRHAGGFANPCTPGYGRRGATCAIDAANPDQAFKLIGNNGVFTNCNTPTATSTPIESPTFTFTATSTNTATNTATPTPTAACPAYGFANGAAITINDNAPASPYPATIAVAGVPGNIYKVAVKLNALNHTFPDDFDVLLVGPGGQNAIIMSDVGGGTDVTSVTLTLDDDAPTSLPDSTVLTTGTFKPTNVGTGDTFPAPAPAPAGGSALSAFVGLTGASLNGTWSLYVVDAFATDAGAFAGGWELFITSDSGTCPTPTNTPINSPTNTNTNTPTPTATSTFTPSSTATATATPTASPTCTPERVADGTFEAGTPWALWTVQTSTAFGTALCNAGCGNGGGTAIPWAGVNWAWFGGTAAAETATLGQSVTIPTGGTATLTFQLFIGAVNTPFTDTLVVTMDGNNIATFTEPAVAETGYTQRSFDVSTYADGAPHALLFTYTAPGGFVSNFSVDNVSIFSTCGPVGAGSISGTVRYGNPASPTTKFISNALVASTIGSPSVSTTTAAPGGTAGQYTLTGFGSGNYTVGVTKTTGQNGIASADAARIAQHVAGTSLIVTSSQRVAADVTNNGALSSTDAAQIARFVSGLGPPIGITNTWRFFAGPPTFPVAGSPTTRSYVGPIGTLTGEDYI
ncbi:MAG: beta strand repeat-containing protein, partial [Pyrinomonadaceae bacterium]